MAAQSFVFVTLILMNIVTSMKTCRSERKSEKPYCHFCDVVTSANVKNNFIFKDGLLKNSEKLIKRISADAFKNMVNVRKIKIRECPFLTELPENIFNHKGFQTVQIIEIQSFSQVNTLPENIFRNTKQLYHIDLRWNMLRKLPPNLFASNTALYQISFTSNRLRSLPAKLFASSADLIYLFLGDNNLESLPSELLASNTILKSINLSYNNLKSLPPQLFASNTKLEYIDLSYNYLLCVSQSQWPGEIISNLDYNCINPTSGICKKTYCGRQDHSKCTNKLGSNINIDTCL